MKPIKLKMNTVEQLKHIGMRLPDGQNYNVEIFRLGRVGLYARTADGDYNAMYSRSEKKWVKSKGIDNDLVIALK